MVRRTLTCQFSGVLARVIGLASVFLSVASIPILMGIAVPVRADQAEQPFFQGKEEGWFWYKDPKDLPVEAPTNPPLQAPAKSKAPASLSVEWLRKQMPVLLDQAIDSPTRENVEAYLYAQRLALDKSQRFS